VSLHDAHPGSRAQITEQVEFLAGYGISRSSILVVPEFHHGGSLLQDQTFSDTVSRWQAQGHEIVLHGYFHDRRESPPEKLSTVFWTRLYTNREAEFLDLPRDSARMRLERGRALFESLGWRATGFVAPAWLMAEGLTNLLAEMGFSYTTRVGEIIPLLPGVNRVKSSQSLCYSTRAPWRRFASALWNKYLYGRLRETDLIRLQDHHRPQPARWRQSHRPLSRCFSQRGSHHLLPRRMQNPSPRLASQRSAARGNPESAAEHL